MRNVAFDAVAPDYDHLFTNTPLARVLRGAVWARLAAHFNAGDRVLELNCGTGEDAIWLAQRGVRVTATDVSTAMLAVTERKARECGVHELIETSMLDLAAPLALQGEGRPTVGVKVDVTSHDGAFSNFGGLNCTLDLRPLAAFLADKIRPHGKLILVPMNRWCAWEMAWHLLHAQPRTAFRRLRREGVEANIGDGKLHVWYPSVGELARTFAPAFALKRVSGSGIGLPPSYLEAVVVRRPALFRWLQRFDRMMGGVFPFNRLADHVILEFERVA